VIAAESSRAGRLALPVKGNERRHGHPSLPRPARRAAVASSVIWSVACALLGAGGFAVIAAWPDPAGAAGGYRTRMRLQMGSLTEITVPDAQYGADAVSRAFGVVERLDAMLSTYKPDSEVMRLAREGALAVSPEFMDIADRSLHWWERTGGAFDPLLAPVIELWRQAAKAQVMPTPEALERARRLGDPALVRLDRAAGRITFAEPGMGFDFGAIGKGYAVDLAAESLHRDGVTEALVASGGSSHRLIGTPAETGCWELGVRHPEDAERAVAWVRMGEGGMATSAQAGQPITIAGQTLGHILDPRTGRPSQPDDAVWSATVVGPEATDADALSTAVVVMGASRGLALIESLPGFEALLVMKGASNEPEFRATPGLLRDGTLDGLPLFVHAPAGACRARGAARERPSALALAHIRPEDGHVAASRGPLLDGELR
jgi:thiamine biosynthesis lipoprotein